MSTYRNLVVAILDDMLNTARLVGGPNECYSIRAEEKWREQLEQLDEQHTCLQPIESNPDGLHQHYIVQKADGTCEPNAKYFVLRLDLDGNDKEHAEACRKAAQTYIRNAPKHMRRVAEELVEWAGLQEKEDKELNSQIQAMIDKLTTWVRLESFGFSLNWLDGCGPYEPGWVVGYAKDGKAVEVDDDGYQKRYSTQLEAVNAAARVVARGPQVSNSPS
jgi:hypothetical protein